MQVIYDVVDRNLFGSRARKRISFLVFTVNDQKKVNVSTEHVQWTALHRPCNIKCGCEQQKMTLKLDQNRIYVFIIEGQFVRF